MSCHGCATMDLLDKDDKILLLSLGDVVGGCSALLILNQSANTQIIN